MRSETPIHFYKQDHDHDPVRVGRYVLFGVQDCMRLLRPVVKIGNLIVAIGGRTAKDGLADRLTWAGIVIGRRPDGVVICLGFLLGPYGPRTWRARFPLIAAFIDPVSQGHRNQSITPE